MKKTVDITRLSQIINDVWEAVERSKIGQIYVHDAQGNILIQNGVPVCSMAGLQTFQLVLQQVIPKEMEITPN